MIICLSGLAGSGKDTVANYLYLDFSASVIALADPMKNFVREIFGFSYEQLWGPSEMRNAVDSRWGVSPRRVLQTLGTEWGRTIHPELWLRYGLKAAEQSVEKRTIGTLYQSSRDGSWHERGPKSDPIVVITDCRFSNEVQFFKTAGAKIVRIIRRSNEGLSGEAGKHISEMEQRLISNDEFDAVIENDGTLEELRTKMIQMVHGLRGEE